MSTNIDFTPELADLVMFMSDVAISIRMHTPYNKTARDSAAEHCKHMLWLSDSIHHFGELARRIKENNIEDTIRAVKYVIARYEEYQTVGGKWVSDPMLTFKTEPAEPIFGKSYDGWVLDKGLAVLKRIKEKAEQAKNLTTEKTS